MQEEFGQHLGLPLRPVELYARCLGAVGEVGQKSLRLPIAQQRQDLASDGRLVQLLLRAHRYDGLLPFRE